MTALGLGLSLPYGNESAYALNWPSLAYRFTDGTTSPYAGTATITYTGSGGTYFNSAGVLTAATTNVPRIDYDPVTLACRGLLVEEQRTNLVLQSEDFAAAAWGTSGTPTISSGAKTRGLLSLDLIGDDSAAAAERVQQVVTFTGDGSKSFSIFVSNGSSTTSGIQLRDNTAAVNRVRAIVTWSGTVPSVNMVAGTLEGTDYIGGDIYRLRFIAAGIVAANQNQIQILPAYDDAGTVSLTGDIYVGGVQAENATFASSYIPTTTAQVTRTADVPTVAVGSWYNASEGTLYVEASMSGADATSFPRVVELNDGTSNENIGILRNNSSGQFRTRCQDNNVSQFAADFGAFPANGTAHRAAYAYKTDDHAASVDGAPVVTDASGTIPTVTQLVLGGVAHSGAQILNGHLREVRYYPRRLPNATLQSLTA